MRNLCGQVAEWLNAAVLKTAVRVSVPWVRIPPCPPDSQSLHRQRMFTHRFVIGAALPCEFGGGPFELGHRTHRLSEAG